MLRRVIFKQSLYYFTLACLLLISLFYRTTYFTGGPKNRNVDQISKHADVATTQSPPSRAATTTKKSKSTSAATTVRLSTTSRTVSTTINNYWRKQWNYCKKIGVNRQPSSVVASYIKSMDIKGPGCESRIVLQSQTENATPQLFGGDDWQVKINGPASLYNQVIDLHNGTYIIQFIPVEIGIYNAFITLDFTNCYGLKDPPADWFSRGNIHGSNQKPDLDYIRSHFQNKALWDGARVQFEVKNVNKSTCKRVIPNVPKCANTIWNPHGRWIAGMKWRTYSKIKQECQAKRLQGNASQRGTLWVYGDSLAARYARSVHAHASLCTKIFEGCQWSYNWVYRFSSMVDSEERNGKPFNATRVIDEFKSVLTNEKMAGNENSVMIVNFGLHFVSALSFKIYQLFVNELLESIDNWRRRNLFYSQIIYKSTTAVYKERLANPYHPSRQFITSQRIMLFNEYAMEKFCKRGYLVLDLYGLTASYPMGTQTRFTNHDAFHYDDYVFNSVTEAIGRYYSC